MKTTKKMAAVLALILAFTIPVLAFAEVAPAPEKTYTIEEMLTLALQNEYETQALYTQVADAFQAKARMNRPAWAGSNHAATLTALLEAYGFAVPENTFAGQLKAPASLEEAHAAAALLAEKSTGLYDSFLAQDNLPDSLRTVFTALKTRSQNHQNAFLRVSQRSGMGRGMGSGMGRGGMINRRMAERGRQNRMQGNSETCPVCGGSCTALPGN